MKRLILHPTDLSPETFTAFAHALRISVNDRSGIYIIHADDTQNKHLNWNNYPAVRKTLHRWGEVEADLQKEKLNEKLGIDIKKVATKANKIVDAIITFRNQRRYGIDLLIVGTQRRKGLPRWIKPSTSEQIARKVNVPTLFVPNITNKFVNYENGTVLLENILIAVDHSPPAQIGITAAAEFLRRFRHQKPVITLLHVGKEEQRPVADLHLFNNLKSDYLSKNGVPVEEILNTADTIDADLIVMTSHGHDGFLDVLRGSVTERVLRESRCPLLMIPANES